MNAEPPIARFHMVHQPRRPGYARRFYVLTWPPEIVEAVRMQPSLTRRRFVGFTVGALTLPRLAGCVRRDHSKIEGTDGMGDRVVFVCRDKSDAFSPGVYLHAGGGGAFDLLRDAAMPPARSTMPRPHCADTFSGSLGLRLPLRGCCQFLTRPNRMLTGRSTGPPTATATLAS